MVKVRTLNELSQLGESEFNQPPPRHGLNLLHWFACLYKDSYLLNPQSGAYGFHVFYNRIDDDDDQLLPRQNFPYFEVGNLNAIGAEKLPKYIRPRNGHYTKESNKDRIIVRMNDRGSIDRVYVTEHEDQKNFDSRRTYRVSQGLLDQIRGMQREQFLNKMQQQRKPQVTYTNAFSFAEQSYTPRNDFYTQPNNATRNQGYTNQQSDNSWSWCTIL